MTEKQRLGYIKRSQNPSWKASRTRAAKAGAAGLRRNKQVWLDSRVKASASLREKYGDPAYKQKHRVACLKNAKRPEWHEALSKGQKRKYRRNGQGFYQSKVSQLEIFFASLLRKTGLDFVVQYRIPDTWYTADIYVPEVNLIVEVDGLPENWKNDPRNKRIERRRDRKIRALGYSILHVRPRKKEKSCMRWIGRVLRAVGRLEAQC